MKRYHLKFVSLVLKKYKLLSVRQNLQDFSVLSRVF